MEVHPATFFTLLAAPLFWVVSYLGNFKPLDFIITRAVFALLGAISMTVAGILYNDVGILLAEVPFILMNSYGIHKGIQLKNGGTRGMSYELPDYDILNYYNSVETIDYNVKLIGANSVWSKTRGDRATIAILDTGIDVTHQDLAPNLVLALDFTHENDPQDFIGHGTHCAGIIAGCDNGLGIVGVAPRAKIISLKVIAQNKGSSSTLSKALKWVLENNKQYNINIISMSLGGRSHDPVVEKLLVQIKEAGIIVVCAAGNSGQGTTSSSTVTFPARLAAKGLCISVGAVDQTGGLAGFSSSGSTGEVTFVSPGVEVYSTFINNRYIKLSGTSMATPSIAGLLALIVSLNPEINTLEEAIEKLRTLTKSLGPIEKFGFGMPRIRPDLM